MTTTTTTTLRPDAATLLTMLTEGWLVSEVDSTDDQLLVELRRGREAEHLALDRAEASRLLVADL